MKKRSLLMIIGILMIFLTIGCGKNNSEDNVNHISNENQNSENKFDEETSKEYTNKVEQLEGQMNSLKTENEKMKNLININNSENEKMKNLININNNEKENFFNLSYMTLDFVRAQTTRNIDKLNTLLSEDWEVIQKASRIYAVGEDIEWILYHEDFGIYEDMLIQAYEYDFENDIYIINIRQFYRDPNGEGKTPPTYIDLYFKKINDEWKIVDLTFDV